MTTPYSYNITIEGFAAVPLQRDTHHARLENGSDLSV